MEFPDLFKLLDCDNDGKLTTGDLQIAADRLGWGWHEAPVFAVLDLFARFGPISPESFEKYLKQIAQDPLGPYGRVLASVPFIWRKGEHLRQTSETPRANAVGTLKAGGSKSAPSRIDAAQLVPILEETAGEQAAADYIGLVEKLETSMLSFDKTALLIIDPQRSFTQGAWMRSIGMSGKNDVKPIDKAFENCARTVQIVEDRVEIVFSRCPFPPGSYDWDQRLKETIGDSRPYFVKPGNSILFPPSNGFEEWIDRCLVDGKTTLAMGGCTLNSCVRVSSVETKRLFRKKGLDVVVDLSVSGARASNYMRSALFRGMSSVEFAVEQMRQDGVEVVRGVRWE